MDITPLLERSAREHSHLCPRQVLGIRMGMAAMRALGFQAAPPKRKMLVICETDGCFVDGVIAATACSEGHRSLRVVDYGKIAATFIDVRTERALRLAPGPRIRERASAMVANERRPYFAQLEAYQIMPDGDLLSIREVVLNTRVGHILSQPGRRVHCDQCGEEIINGREIQQDGSLLCRACAGQSYYHVSCEDLAEILLPT